MKKMYQINRYLSDVFTNWGSGYIEHGLTIKSKLDKFHSYFTHESESMRELLRKRFVLKENCVKTENKLESKKNNLLKVKDMK